jgi:hypothetical protein
MFLKKCHGMENLFNAKTPRFKIIGNYCPHWGPRATFNQATSLDKMHLKSKYLCGLLYARISNSKSLT